MGAVGLDKPHSLEAGDPVVNVDDQLLGRELQGELTSQVLGSRRCLPPSSDVWSPHSAEQLGIGGEEEGDPWLRAPCRHVDICAKEGGLELEVKIEVRLG